MASGDELKLHTLPAPVSPICWYFTAMLLLVSASVNPSGVFADPQAVLNHVPAKRGMLHTEPTRVGLMVRTVMGSGLVSGEAANRKVDKRLRDLSNKLRKLQYKEYSLLSSQDAQLDVTQKKVLHLPKGHSLAVRPLYIKGERVGMWLKWKDGGGMKILDTRMHFTCGENMITGTDNTHDSGIILAISVSPLP